MIWIQTYKGVRFDLEHPTLEMIDIEDIAHALAYLCRYTGHTSEFYSVAQHSVMVARRCSIQWQLAGLLHDATEAYLGDVSAPLKKLLPDYQSLEQRIYSFVATRFNLPPKLPDEVREADLRMLMTEKRCFFKDDLEWDIPVKPYDVPYIVAWDPSFAEEVFLEEFHDLTIDLTIGATDG